MGHTDRNTDGHRTARIVVQGPRPPQAHAPSRHHSLEQAFIGQGLRPGPGPGLAGLPQGHRQTPCPARQHGRRARFHRLVQRHHAPAARDRARRCLQPVSRLPRRARRLSARHLEEQAEGPPDGRGSGQPGRHLRRTAQSLRGRPAMSPLVAVLALLPVGRFVPDLPSPNSACILTCSELNQFRISETG